MIKNNDNGINWKTSMLGEALLLTVLSRAIRNDPDRKWLQSLIDEDVFSESPLDPSNRNLEQGLAHLQSWSQDNKDGLSEERFLDLQTDYSRLFIGPGRPIAPPWESVYFNEDRMLFQEQTIDVRNWYKRFGLESQKLYQEPDDHIGLELSFLAHLAGLGVQALEQQDDERLQESLVAQKQFLSQHPLQWMDVWTGLVIENAHTDFYRGIGRMIRGALLAIAATLQVDTPHEIKR